MPLDPNSRAFKATQAYKDMTNKTQLDVVDVQFILDNAAILEDMESGYSLAKTIADLSKTNGIVKWALELVAYDASGKEVRRQIVNDGVK